MAASEAAKEAVCISRLSRELGISRHKDKTVETQAAVDTASVRSCGRETMDGHQLFPFPSKVRSLCHTAPIDAEHHAHAQPCPTSKSRWAIGRSEASALRAG